MSDHGSLNAPVTAADPTPCVGFDALALAGNIPLARDELVGFAADNGADEATQSDVAVAVTEALTNVVWHAYARESPGNVHIAADVESGALEIVILDEGRGLLSDGVAADPGLGLVLIALSTTCFEIVDRPPHGTEVWMRFELDS